jgi:hypothetical protein
MLTGLNAQEIEASLRPALAEADVTIGFDVLANYLAGEQIALMHRWLEKHRPHPSKPWPKPSTACSARQSARRSG